MWELVRTRHTPLPPLRAPNSRRRERERERERLYDGEERRETRFKLGKYDSSLAGETDSDSESVEREAGDSGEAEGEGAKREGGRRGNDNGVR